MLRRKYLITFVLSLTLIFATVSLTSAQSTTTVPYTVQPGDSLSKIAREYCTTWQEIYQLNRGIIGADPNVLEPGTVIYVIPRCGGQPSQCEIYDTGPRLHATGTVSGNVYTVAWGDTFYSIGLRFGVPWQVLAQANNTDKVEVGQQLIIPGLCQSQPVPGQSYITVSSPLPGAYVNSPYFVSGTGGGLLEGNVVVRLLDGSGLLMAQQTTTLQGQNVSFGGPGVWSVQFNNVIGQPLSNGTIEVLSPGTSAQARVPIWFTGN